MSPEEIAYQVLNGDRIGSGLKDDIYHRAPSWVTKEELLNAKITVTVGGDGHPYFHIEVPAVVNDMAGIFEYIVDSYGKVTHQLFIPK